MLARTPSICLLLLATSLPAQSLELTGTVQRITGTPCDPRATHVVQCTDIELFSSTVDLQAWEGKVADLVATPGWNFACSVLDVLQARTATARTTWFSLFGVRPGSNVVITTFAPVGSLVSYLFANGPGFVPLPLGAGAFELDPFSTMYWTTDVSIGVALRTLPIPNESSLVGVEARFQTLYVALTPTPGLRLLNASCFTVGR